MHPPPTVSALTLPLLESAMLERGWKRGRAPALLRALYSTQPLDEPVFGSPVVAWASSLPLTSLSLLRRSQSADGTVKLLLSASGETIECVLMPGEKTGEFAGCISSQVGCAMGCDFCASTIGGVVRNLTDEEIVGQFLLLRREAFSRGGGGGRLNTIVFMGMGEPLLNLPNVLLAIHRIAHPHLGALGYKNVQVSTVGIVPGIRELAASGARVQLALSLHGPDDATRQRIVPAGKKYTVADTLDAAWHFQQATGRVSNIEYCLLADVNDSPDQARLLASALAGRRMHVNLIPHNPIGPGLSGTHYRAPSPARVRAFLDTLRDAGVVAHLRKTRGDDASAACGQLRRVQLTLLTHT